MGGFAAFATGFIGGLNKQHEEARAQEDEWLLKAGERFDAAYKAKQERDVAGVKRNRQIESTAALLGGDTAAATDAVDAGIDLTNPETLKQFWYKRKGSKPAPIAQQTEQSGMIPPAPDKSMLSQVKQTPVQQAQVPAQAQGTPQPAPLGPRKGLAPVPEVFKPIIEAHAQRTGLDPALIGAVFMQESGARPEVINGSVTSSKGATGPMQTMPDTLKNPGFGVVPARDDSEDEKWRVGTDYLAAMLKRYKDVPVALAAYNWGPGHVDEWLTNPQDPANPAKLPAETRKYIEMVRASLPGAQPQPRPGPTKEAAAALPGMQGEMEKLKLAINDPANNRNDPPSGKPSVIPAAEMQQLESQMTQDKVEGAGSQTASSPSQGTSGWQIARDLLTGRRDPGEVADRGVAKAGAQYGFSAEESRAIMRGDDINGGYRSTGEVEMGFGDKPADMTGIVESFMKPDNFRKGDFGKAFAAVSRGDYATAAGLAMDADTKNALEAASKGNAEGTAAMRLRSVKIQDAMELWGVDEKTATGIEDGYIKTFQDQRTNQVTIVNTQTGEQFEVIPKNPDGSVRDVVTLETVQKNKENLTTFDGASRLIEKQVAAITNNPNLVGIWGEVRSTGGGILQQLAPGPLGELVEKYAKTEDVARLRSNAESALGRLVQTVTGDTSGRYSNFDIARVQSALGAVSDPKTSARQILAALDEVQQALAEGRVRAIQGMSPGMSDEKVVGRLIRHYEAMGVDGDKAEEYAARDFRLYAEVK